MDDIYIIGKQEIVEPEDWIVQGPTDVCVIDKR